jgi:hypothetical protein
MRFNIGTRYILDEDNLQERWTHLQQGRHTPTPVTSDVGCADCNACRDNGTDEVRSVEQGGQVWTFFGVAEFTNEGGAGDDAENDTNTQQHTGNDVHADCFGCQYIGGISAGSKEHTVLREALKDGTNHHDQ